jgi:hypothetical protein
VLESPWVRGEFIRKLRIMPKICLTFIFCTTATGQSVLPMILLKGKCLKREWNESLSPGMTVMTTVKANITGEVSHKWLQRSARHKVAENPLLISDRVSNQLCRAGGHLGLFITVCRATRLTSSSNLISQESKLLKCMWVTNCYCFGAEILKSLTELTFGSLSTRMWPRAVTSFKYYGRFSYKGRLSVSFQR